MNTSNRNAVFDKVGIQNLSRTAFNLSESVSFDVGFGDLIPTYCRYAVPGDTFHIAPTTIVKFNPMISPVFMECSYRHDLFFVPFRLLWFGWDEFITKGATGEVVSEIPVHVTRGKSDYPNTGVSYFNTKYYRYSFWDYIGFPMPRFFNENGEDISAPDYLRQGYVEAWTNRESLPHIFPYTAYLDIYNEYYRDQNLEPKKFIWYGSRDIGYNWRNDLPDAEEYRANFIVPPHMHLENTILKRAYRKDYFTSMLPFQQRGIIPSIPLYGEIPVNFPNTMNLNLNTNLFTSFGKDITSPGVLGDTQSGIGYSGLVTSVGGDNAKVYKVLEGGSGSGESTNTSTPLQLNTSLSSTVFNGTNINLNSGVTADLNQFRLAFAILHWMETNARTGVRYTEFLKGHFGVSPNDETLQRPRYIGSLIQPVVVSEVLQTSESNTTPLGDYAGYAQSADSGSFDPFFCEEFGVIMCISTLIPKVRYTQGIRREFTTRTPFDMFFPEFQHLSEQEVRTKEIYVDFQKYVNADTEPERAFADDEIIGFQGRYNDLRTSQDRVAGGLRDNSQGKWTLNRTFKEPPLLNESFIKIDNDEFMDLFAYTEKKPAIVNIDFNITAIRPLQYTHNPGLPRV